MALAALLLSLAGAWWILANVAEGVAVEIWGESWELLEPKRLALVALGPMLAWVTTLSLADLPRAQRWLGWVLRWCLISALALTLARPTRVHESTTISTVFLVDVSDSVADASLESATEHVRSAFDSRGDNDVQLISFASTAKRLALKEGEALKITRHAQEENRATNLQAALQLAYGVFPPGHLRRVVLLSDGSQTHGDLLAEASNARRFDVEIFYRRYTEPTPPEVALRDLTLPDQIEVGQPFFVRARVYSTTPTRARIKLYQGETLNGLDSVRDVELAAGDTEIEMRSIVHRAGPVTYRMQMKPEGADRFDDNNDFDTTIVVPGKPTVLYVEGAQGRSSYLAQALSTADFDVDVRSPRAIPTSTKELEQFDFFVLSDVSADQVGLSQQDAIDRYVRDLGGGFIMAGGERGYGLGGWQGTRMERLLPVKMDSQRRRDQPTLALALVIDRSGSMRGPKMELAKEAAKATSEMLSADDQIGVIGFDSQPTRVVRMQGASNRLRISRDIGRLQAQGGTAIFPALDMAYQDLSITRAKVKHVILLTDGQAPEQGIAELVQVMRAEGMTVSTIGLGADVNQGLLRSVATQGGGRSYFTNDPHNIPRIFMRETSTVARSSAVEEYFTPAVQTRADFLRGIDMARAPFLHGYVATQAKPTPAQVVLVSDLGEPILARWRVGLGWSMAWTSDVKNRWAVEWVRWPGFSRFWAQLVREHMRQRRRRRLDMQAQVIGDEVRVVVNGIDRDDRFMNDLDSTLKVEGPMAAKAADRVEVELPFRQTAPGRYEARLPLSKYGSFVLSAIHRQEGRLVAESIAQLAHPYPQEYAQSSGGDELLERAAVLTEGKADPTIGELNDANGKSIRSHEEAWPKLIYLILGLFLLDLLLRRVRLFDRHFKTLPAGA